MFRKLIGIIFIIFILMAIGYLVLTLSASESCSCAKNQLDVEPPYYVVQTTSLYYIALEMHETNDAVIIQNYYVKVGDKWIFRDAELTLNRAAYGKIKVKLIEK